MESTSASGKNIEAALELLEEAARQKKDELKGVMSDKYAHLKSVISETESALVGSLANARRQAGEVAEHAKTASLEKVRDVAGGVDRQAHGHPWAFIGATALAGLMFGYILGRHPR